MKLGSQTGSVINHLLARSTIGQPDPEPGMGATILLWTDRNPATVVEVTNLWANKAYDMQVAVTEDEVTEDGFEPRPGGHRKYFRRRREGGQWVQTCWSDAGQMAVARGGEGLLMGQRDHYRDPSF